MPVLVDPVPAAIIAKESLGNFPMLGPHLKRTGHMLVDRSKPDRSGILDGQAADLERLSLIVFPKARAAAPA